MSGRWRRRWFPTVVGNPRSLLSGKKKKGKGEKRK
jgi:hypothetical protein